MIFKITQRLKFSSIFLFLLSLNVGSINAIPQIIQTPSNLYYFRNAPLFTSADFYWDDNSTNETGFVLEQKIDGENWTKILDIQANTTTTTIANLSPDASATYRVRAVINADVSDASNLVRLVGKSSKLEVFPEIPAIRNPKDTTINGITFGMLQDQCPVQPEKGKATRISTFYTLQVRKASDTEWLNSPVYEIRPQIRNLKAQNIPSHSNGHRPYGYGLYGPSSTVPAQQMHSKHWTNFDAAENVVVRVTLLSNDVFQGPINENDLDIQPAPLSISNITTNTVDITLPGAQQYSGHYRICINRKAWATAGGRKENTYENPLFVFVNPMHIAPASAPDNQIKTFNNNSIVVYGAGIFLPNDNYRFFGEGGNSTCREMYVPANTYIHTGFIFKNDNYGIRIWGRGIYSDEMFAIYKDIAPSEQYVYSTAGRTPWSTVEGTTGNPWGKVPTTWEARVGFYGKSASPAILEGLTNIGARMGIVNEDGNAEIIDHKDMGYGGGTYQMGDKAKTVTRYYGCLLENDDDITYMHMDFIMDHCTSYNHRNGPSFQYGWGVMLEYKVNTKVLNHTCIDSDRGTGVGYWKNLGVFNTRLRLGELLYHNGGLVENLTVWGQESVVFNIRIWEEGVTFVNRNSIFEDKTFKNITIMNHSRHKNVLWGDQNTTRNQKSYLRFLHFDNLVINGSHIDNIYQGSYFEYNSALLLHTITFFSLPNAVAEPLISDQSFIGKEIKLSSSVNSKNIQQDLSLPQSLGPLCANTDVAGTVFKVLDAGDGYIALKAPNNNFVRADTNRYGYLFTLPDNMRGDADFSSISENAKFKIVNLNDGKIALYSKAMGLYVRMEQNCGSNMPLYGASNAINANETFITDIVSAVNDMSSPQVKVYQIVPGKMISIDNASTNQIAFIQALDGRNLLDFKITSNHQLVNVEDIPSGVYLIRISEKNNNVIKKIILRK